METTDKCNKIVQSFSEVDFSEMVLPGIVIYNSPSDFDGVYVCRLYEMSISEPTDIIIVRSSLEECRKDINKSGFYARLKRDTRDVLSIVEIWV